MKLGILADTLRLVWVEVIGDIDFAVLDELHLGRRLAGKPPDNPVELGSFAPVIRIFLDDDFTVEVPFDELVRTCSCRRTVENVLRRVRGVRIFGVGTAILDDEFAVDHREWDRSDRLDELGARRFPGQFECVVVNSLEAVANLGDKEGPLILEIDQTIPGEDPVGRGHHIAGVVELDALLDLDGHRRVVGGDLRHAFGKHRLELIDLTAVRKVIERLVNDVHHRGRIDLVEPTRVGGKPGAAGR